MGVVKVIDPGIQVSEKIEVVHDLIGMVEVFFSIYPRIVNQMNYHFLKDNMDNFILYIKVVNDMYV